jgi:hypothetical protein
MDSFHVPLTRSTHRRKKKTPAVRLTLGRMTIDSADRMDLEAHVVRPYLPSSFPLCQASFTASRQGTLAYGRNSGAPRTEDASKDFISALVRVGAKGSRKGKHISSGHDGAAGLTGVLPVMAVEMKSKT